MWLSCCFVCDQIVCHERESCASSQIRAVTEIQAFDDGLSGSTIISDLGGGTLTLTMNGTSSEGEGHTLHCNKTDTCKIACKSQFACQKLGLTCVGSCYVDCDAENGIECPFVGIWQYYNSSENDGSTITTLTSTTTEATGVFREICLWTERKCDSVWLCFKFDRWQPVL